MQDTDVPAKFPIPFGNAAGPTMIRPIPVASQIGTNPGAASLTDGFVPLNAQPIEAGGIPPDVRDMNGILDQVTAWARWHSAGGPDFYDPAFSAAIDGYPAGSVVKSSTTGKYWESTTDNNTTNPDAGGAGWVPFLHVAIQSMAYNTAVDTGGINNITISLNPAPASLAAIKGALISIVPANANTGSATLNVNGLGAKPIVNIDRSGLAASQIVGGMIVVVWDGTNFTLVSGSRYMPDGTAPGQAVTYDQFNHQFDIGGQPITGYQQLPSGYLEQWGVGNLTSINQTFNFNVAFPVECFNVMVEEWNPTNGTWGGGFPTVYAAQSNPNQAQFSVWGLSWAGSFWVAQTGGTFRWRAIGR